MNYIRDDKREAFLFFRRYRFAYVYLGMLKKKLGKAETCN
jgi:hypothetical protein